jgi:hypothetical protein
MLKTNTEVTVIHPGGLPELEAFGWGRACLILSINLDLFHRRRIKTRRLVNSPELRDYDEQLPCGTPRQVPLEDPE